MSTYRLVDAGSNATTQRLQRARIGTMSGTANEVKRIYVGDIDLRLQDTSDNTYTTFADANASWQAEGNAILGDASSNVDVSVVVGNTTVTEGDAALFYEGAGSGDDQNAYIKVELDTYQGSGSRRRVFLKVKYPATVDGQGSTNGLSQWDNQLLQLNFHSFVTGQSVTVSEDFTWNVYLDVTMTSGSFTNLLQPNVEHVVLYSGDATIGAANVGTTNVAVGGYSASLTQDGRLALGTYQLAYFNPGQTEAVVVEVDSDSVTDTHKFTASVDVDGVVTVYLGEVDGLAADIDTAIDELIGGEDNGQNVTIYVMAYDSVRPDRQVQLEFEIRARPRPEFQFAFGDAAVKNGSTPYVFVDEANKYRDITLANSEVVVDEVLTATLATRDASSQYFTGTGYQAYDGAGTFSTNTVWNIVPVGDSTHTPGSTTGVTITFYDDGRESEITTPTGLTWQTTRAGVLSLTQVGWNVEPTTSKTPIFRDAMSGNENYLTVDITANASMNVASFRDATGNTELAADLIGTTSTPFAFSSNTLTVVDDANLDVEFYAREPFVDKSAQQIRAITDLTANTNMQTTYMARAWTAPLLGFTAEVTTTDFVIYCTALPNATGCNVLVNSDAINFVNVTLSGSATTDTASNVAAQLYAALGGATPNVGGLDFVYRYGNMLVGRFANTATTSSVTVNEPTAWASDPQEAITAPYLTGVRAWVVNHPVVTYDFGTALATGEVGDTGAQIWQSVANELAVSITVPDIGTTVTYYSDADHRIFTDANGTDSNTITFTEVDSTTLGVDLYLHTGIDSTPVNGLSIYTNADVYLSSTVGQKAWINEAGADFIIQDSGDDRLFQLEGTNVSVTVTEIGDVYYYMSYTRQGAAILEPTVANDGVVVLQDGALFSSLSVSTDTLKNATDIEDTANVDTFYTADTTRMRIVYKGGVIQNVLSATDGGQYTVNLTSDMEISGLFTIENDGSTSRNVLIRTDGANTIPVYDAGNTTTYFTTWNTIIEAGQSFENGRYSNEAFDVIFHHGDTPITTKAATRTLNDVILLSPVQPQTLITRTIGSVERDLGGSPGTFSAITPYVYENTTASTYSIAIPTEAGNTDNGTTTGYFISTVYVSWPHAPNAAVNVVISGNTSDWRLHQEQNTSTNTALDVAQSGYTLAAGDANANTSINLLTSAGTASKSSAQFHLLLAANSQSTAIALPTLTITEAGVDYTIDLSNVETEYGIGASVYRFNPVKIGSVSLNSRHYNFVEGNDTFFGVDDAGIPAIFTHQYGIENVTANVGWVSGDTAALSTWTKYSNSTISAAHSNQSQNVDLWTSTTDWTGAATTEHGVTYLETNYQRPYINISQPLLAIADLSDATTTVTRYFSLGRLASGGTGQPSANTRRLVLFTPLETSPTDVALYVNVAASATAINGVREHFGIQGGINFEISDNTLTVANTTSMMRVMSINTITDVSNITLSTNTELVDTITPAYTYSGNADWFKATADSEYVFTIETALSQKTSPVTMNVEVFPYYPTVYTFDKPVLDLASLGQGAGNVSIGFSKVGGTSGVFHGSDAGSIYGISTEVTGNTYVDSAPTLNMDSETEGTIAFSEITNAHHGEVLTVSINLTNIAIPTDNANVVITAVTPAQDPTWVDEGDNLFTPSSTDTSTSVLFLDADIIADVYGNTGILTSNAYAITTNVEAAAVNHPLVWFQSNPTLDSGNAAFARSNTSALGGSTGSNHNYPYQHQSGSQTNVNIETMFLDPDTYGLTNFVERWDRQGLFDIGEDYSGQTSAPPTYAEWTQDLENARFIHMYALAPARVLPQQFILDVGTWESNTWTSALTAGAAKIVVTESTNLVETAYTSPTLVTDWTDDMRLSASFTSTATPGTTYYLTIRPPGSTDQSGSATTNGFLAARAFYYSAPPLVGGLSSEADNLFDTIKYDAWSHPDNMAVQVNLSDLIVYDATSLAPESNTEKHNMHYALRLFASVGTNTSIDTNVITSEPVNDASGSTWSDTWIDVTDVLLGTNNRYPGQSGAGIANKDQTGSSDFIIVSPDTATSSNVDNAALVTVRNLAERIWLNASTNAVTDTAPIATSYMNLLTETRNDTDEYNIARIHYRLGIAAFNSAPDELNISVPGTATAQTFDDQRFAWLDFYSTRGTDGTSTRTASTLDAVSDTSAGLGVKTYSTMSTASGIPAQVAEAATASGFAVQLLSAGIYNSGVTDETILRHSVSESGDYVKMMPLQSHSSFYLTTTANLDPLSAVSSAQSEAANILASVATALGESKASADGVALVGGRWVRARHEWEPVGQVGATTYRPNLTVRTGTSPSSTETMSYTIGSGTAAAVGVHFIQWNGEYTPLSIGQYVMVEVTGAVSAADSQVEATTMTGVVVDVGSDGFLFRRTSGTNMATDADTTDVATSVYASRINTNMRVSMGYPESFAYRPAWLDNNGTPITQWVEIGPDTGNANVEASLSVENYTGRVVTFSEAPGIDADLIHPGALVYFASTTELGDEEDYKHIGELYMVESYTTSSRKLILDHVPTNNITGKYPILLHGYTAMADPSVAMNDGGTLTTAAITTDMSSANTVTVTSGANIWHGADIKFVETTFPDADANVTLVGADTLVTTVTDNTTLALTATPGLTTSSYFLMYANPLAYATVQQWAERGIDAGVEGFTNGAEVEQDVAVEDMQTTYMRLTDVDDLPRVTSATSHSVSLSEGGTTYIGTSGTRLRLHIQPRTIDTSVTTYVSAS